MNEADFIPYAADVYPESGSVLVLAPHPDDEVLGCAGAILRHVEAGDPVQVIIVTDATLLESAAYAETRRLESKAAAAILGYGEPTFWDLPDRGLQYGEWLIQRVAECIDRYRADWVYAPSCREIHPDHRALGLAAAEAVRRCVRPTNLVMYEVGTPLQPNRLLDITDLADRKQAAMACFSSQIERQAYDRQISALNRFRTYTLPPTVQAAEAYRVVTRDQLCADPVTALRQETFAAPGWSAETSLDLPLVSVVVCCSGKAGLEETLDSIALQVYPHIEILVAGETHPVQSVLPEWWGRFPLRRVPSDWPLSPAQAANLGLELARGDYLALIDENTALAPDHVSTLVEILRQSPQAACAAGGVIPRDDRQAGGLRNAPFPAEKLLRKDAPSLRSVLFPRSLLRQGCRFDETLTVLEDRDFLLQLSQHSLLIGSDRVTVRLRAPAVVNFSPAHGETPGADADAALLEKWRMLWSGRQWADLVQSCDRQVASVERQAAELRTELAAKSAESERLRGMILELEAAVRGARDDNRSLRVWAAGLQQTLESLQASSSWRLTRPLRFFARMVRGQIRIDRPGGD